MYLKQLGSPAEHSRLTFDHELFIGINKDVLDYPTTYYKTDVFALTVEIVFSVQSCITYIFKSIQL